MRRIIWLLAGVAFLGEGRAQPATDEALVLKVVDAFFDALEAQDTTAIKDLYVEGGRNYSIFENGTSVRLRYQDASAIRFSPGQVIRERMRKESTEVKIQRRIAMVWAPYDLWVNDTFSHCGVDIFSLVKTDRGWKVTSIAYTIEKTGCQ